MWRKQATISVQDEFSGRALPPDLEESLPANLTELFDTVRRGVKRSAEVYIQLCTLLERLAKRNEGLAADQLRFSLALQSLTEVTRETYAVDTNDVPLLNEGIKATARHLTASQSLLEDEARAWEAGMLEDLKRQRDCLVSVRDLFDRRDRYARNNIPQLERRIEGHERRLEELRAGGTGKPGEIEKAEDAIFKVCFLPLSSFLVNGSWLISISRTKSPLCNSMHAGSSSGSACAMSWCTSSKASITSADSIRTGVRNVSNTQNCRRIIGDR